MLNYCFHRLLLFIYCFDVLKKPKKICTCQLSYVINFYIIYGIYDSKFDCLADNSFCTNGCWNSRYYSYLSICSSFVGTSKTKNPYGSTNCCFCGLLDLSDSYDFINVFWFCWRILNCLDTLLRFGSTYQFSVYLYRLVHYNVSRKVRNGWVYFLRSLTLCRHSKNANLLINDLWQSKVIEEWCLSSSEIIK